MTLLIPNEIEESYRKNEFFSKCEGISIFIDICGYTNLTNILIEYAQEGIELLSNLTNQIFTPIIDLIHIEKGTIVSFEGDSILAIFPDRDRLNDDEYLLKACIKQIFDKYKYKRQELINKSNLKDRLIDLDIDIQISSGKGEIKSRIISGQQISSYYYYGASIFEALKQHEFSDKKHKVITEFKNYQCFKSYSFSKHQVSKLKNTLTNKFIADDILLLPSDFKGEIREVISCFIKIADFAIIKDKDLQYLDSFIAKTVSIITNYGGYFNRVTYSGKGLFILALFGAPFYREHTVLRAADCVNEIFYLGKQFEVDNSVLNLSAGISYGKAYCGFVGSKTRAEYTALGSNVNLAARLMSKAKKNEIMINQKFKTYINEKYDTEYISRFKIKGFEKLQQVYRLNQNSQINITRENSYSTFGKTKFYGRFLELEELKGSFKSFIFSRIHYKHGLKYFSKIIGTPGIGKTRLVQEVLTEFEDLKIPNIKSYINFFSSSKKEKIGFIEFFIRSNEAAEDNVYVLLDQIIEFIIGEEFGDFKGPKIVGMISYLNNNLNKELYQKHKKINDFLKSSKQILEIVQENGYNFAGESINIYIVDFFKTLSSLIPILLNIDNLQWFNDKAEKIIEEIFLLKSSGKLYLISTERFNITGYNEKFTIINEFKEELTDFQKIVLKPIKSSVVKQVISGYLKKINYKNVSSENLKQMVRFCNGNPLFVEQFLNYLGNNKQNIEFSELLIDSDHTSDLTDLAKIPQGFKNILLSRFDRLNTSQKMILKTASVIGYSFNLQVLAEIMKFSLKSLEYQIYDLTNFNFLTKKGSMISFRHDLLRDLIYNIQMSTEVKLLHSQIANYYLLSKKDNNLESLAYHQYKSNNLKSVINTWHKIAWKAFKIDEFIKAKNYFNKIIKQKYNDCKNEKISWSLIQINIHLGVIYHQIDEFEESNRILQREKEKLQKLLVRFSNVKKYKNKILKHISIILDKQGSNYRFIEENNPKLAFKYYQDSLDIRIKFNLSNYYQATSLNYLIYPEFFDLYSEKKIVDNFYKIGDLLQIKSLKNLLLRIDSVNNIVYYYLKLREYKSCMIYIDYAEKNILCHLKYTDLSHHEIYYYFDYKFYVLKNFSRDEEAFVELNKCIKISENIYGRFGSDTVELYQKKVQLLAQQDKFESAYNLLNYCIDFLKISSKNNKAQLLNFYQEALKIYLYNDDFVKIHEILLDARKYHIKAKKLDVFSFSLDLFQAYASFNTGQIFEANILMEDIEIFLKYLIRNKVDVFFTGYDLDLYILICINHYNIKNAIKIYQQFLNIRRNILFNDYGPSKVDILSLNEEAENIYLRLLNSDLNNLLNKGNSIFNLITESSVKGYYGSTYLFLNLGRIYCFNENYTNSLYFFNIIINSSGSKKDFKIQAKCYIALISFVKSKDTTVIEELLNLKIKYRFNKSLIYEVAGIINYLNNNFQQADEYYKNAFNITRKIVASDNNKLCEIALLMTINYLYLNNFRKASKIISEALPFLKSGNNTDIYYILFKICKTIIKNKIKIDNSEVFNELKKLKQLLKKLQIPKNHTINEYIDILLTEKKLPENEKIFVFL